MSLISPHDFVFKSTDGIIDFTKASMRLFSRIFIMDSIFEFYPYSEVYFVDKQGIIIDNIYFVEGMEFDFKLGNEDDGYLETTVVWNNNNINECFLTNRVVGTNAFVLSHAHKQKDKPNSRAWEDTISNIVKDIAKTDWSITDSTKLFVSDTEGTTKWYQLNKTSEEFVDRILVNYAYSKNNPQAPFYSFINAAGELFFMSLDDLFAQPPTASYSFSENENTWTSYDNVKNFYVEQGGTVVNKQNYKKKIYRFTGSGSFENEESKIEEHIYKQQKDKILVKKDLQANMLYPEYFGLYNATKDKEVFLGKRNSYFVNSCISYRMIIEVFFNPKVISGKTVELTVDGTKNEGQKSQEYSGKWLVIQSEHHMDERGMPFSKLTLVKSGISVDNDHPLINDFVG